MEFRNIHNSVKKISLKTIWSQLNIKKNKIVYYYKIYTFFNTLCSTRKVRERVWSAYNQLFLIIVQNK